MLTIDPRRVVSEVRKLGPLPRFHADFLAGAFDPLVDVAALSVGRGGGKTFLLAKVAAVALTPGSCLWRPELEVLAVSASLAQSRTLVAMLRQHLPLDAYSVAGLRPANLCHTQDHRSPVSGVVIER